MELSQGYDRPFDRFTDLHLNWGPNIFFFLRAKYFINQKFCGDINF